MADFVPLTEALDRLLLGTKRLAWFNTGKLFCFVQCLRHRAGDSGWIRLSAQGEKALVPCKGLRLSEATTKIRAPTGA
jgi:hypothetical protein